MFNRLKLDFIIRRLKERSTWAGLVGLLGSAGLALSPEKSDAIVSAAVALVSLIFMFTEDKADDSSIG